MIAAFPGFFEVAQPGYRKTLFGVGIGLFLTIEYAWGWNKVIQPALAI